MKIENLIPGTEFYHNETCGMLFWGMHKYRVVEFVDRSGWGPEHFDDAVSMIFPDNNGRETDTLVTQKEFDEGFAPTEKEAWKKHADWLQNEIDRYSFTIKKLQEKKEIALQNSLEK
jgi:hypothetical protein